MKALVIGAGGFVGGYLIHELSAVRGWQVCATKLPGEEIVIHYDDPVAEYETRLLDILDEKSIFSLLADVRPDVIFHLAAQSSVALSWKKPALTADINIKGCINLLEAVRGQERPMKVILIGSSEEYGHAANIPEPVDESTVCDPASIYAITKNTQNMLGRLYARSYSMDIISVRAFNHIGSGQLPQFVVSDFCKQAAEIEKNLREPVIRVGNLSAKRDFTDVRDIVGAYGAIAEKGRSGETYNVGSGKVVEIGVVLDKICALSSKKIIVEKDPERFRPVDVPFIEADISKLKKDTGWETTISLDESLSDIFSYWMKKVK